ncbi:hypothetical protein N7471_013090 [Penicillium samsonianum]|uniref:uncharacterized protein n=1 Tax=Penicillium samsonianum TaxID=1882272 RepID=UPI002547BAFB|nr:uncharacterized protein N7471_013090 [Penicillium samsonianum]KAJ6118470.1 hypothetical protein N7471_013090 [Penicillium samsonianum]
MAGSDRSDNDDLSVGAKSSSSSSDLADMKKLSAIDTLHNDEALKVLANYSRMSSFYDKAISSQAAIFAGPLIFKENDAPCYVPGFIVVVTSFVAGVTVLMYRFVCVGEIRKRDQSSTAEGYENAYQDDLTDEMSPQFRDIL